MVLPPPPASSPPHDLACSRLEEAYSSDSEDEDFDVNTMTPLITHGKCSTKGRKNVFRSTLPTCYASIDDAAIAVDKSLNKSASYTEDDDYSQSTRSVTTVSTVTTVMENFRENLMLPFVSDETSLSKIGAGMASLAVFGILLGLVLPKNDSLNGIWNPWYRWVSSVIGYTYFVLWSVCFYPQVLLNMRRKSTRGLSNDFAILNFLGWLFYSLYLSSMYFDHEIKELYEERFKNESCTVQSNDVLFAVHAMTLSFIYLVQIVYYGEKGCSMYLKPQTWFLIVVMVGPSCVVPLLILLGFLGSEKWLDYFYMLSFFKICCTLTKYSKQVVLNWKRKSTSGWNIWYNFLECSGGGLSMLQIVLDSVDMQDMSGISGNLAKVALGMATIFFDAIFFAQHYILYPESKSDGIPLSIKASDTLILSFDSHDGGVDDIASYCSSS